MAFTNSQQQLLGPMPSSTSFRTSPLANQALCKKHQLRMPRTRVIYGQICCGFFLGVLFVNIYYIYIIIYIYTLCTYIHFYPPGIKQLHAYTTPVLDAKHHADAPSDSLHGGDYHRPKFSKIVAGLVNVYITMENHHF
jgi:hypothetical protein